MCGIIAIAGNGTDKIPGATVDAMLAAIASRGPDERDFLRYSRSVLGQNRLAIIDLSAGGHQPKKDNRRNIAITFNGEIYNYRELRRELEAKGHVFSSASDTEAILKAYLEYGSECPKHLDGMFAFAIWNEEAGELFMARDRFGKKPLYYAFDAQGRLYIASEIKALQAAGIQGEIDPQAIDNYLTLMYIPPWKSVYKNVHVLPPAHQAVFRTNGAINDAAPSGKNTLTISRYWSLENKPINPTYAEAKAEIKRLFDEAVKKRMIADVEIGSFLSGGVDSTLVTAYAQRYASHPLKTFSIGYGDHINELPFAEQASKKIGTDHYTLQADGDMIAELEKVIAYMDEPHADSSLFPQHLVSGLAASKVKVALSGDGADELFMGYGWYWKYWNTSKLTRLKNMLFSDQFEEYIKSCAIFPKDERRRLWKNPSALNDDIRGEAVMALDEKNASRGKIDGVKKINTYDLTTYLPGQLLSKVDQTSMMHSLEVRCPFLDYKLAEYVYNLPTEFKMNAAGGGDPTNGKIILKDILTEIMPRDFVYRRKQGFGAPVFAWLTSSPVKEAVQSAFASDAGIYEFLSRTAVQALIGDFYRQPRKEQHYKIWVLFCLELWLKAHRQPATSAQNKPTPHGK